MNKQEAVEKINNMSTFKIRDTTLHRQFDTVDKNKVLDIISQIHEQKKPVVPKFVADWYEKNKDGLEWNLYTICVDFYKRELQDDLHNWFRYSENKPIETLVKMKLFGYEVEKEKLYKVSLKRNGLYIGIQQKDGSVKYKLTKTELSECCLDDLDVYEVEDVEE